MERAVSKKEARPEEVRLSARAPREQHSRFALLLLLLHPFTQCLESEGRGIISKILRQILEAPCLKQPEWEFHHYIISARAEGPGDACRLERRAFISLFSGRVPARPRCLIHSTALSANEWWAHVEVPHTRTHTQSHVRRQKPPAARWVHVLGASPILIRRESKGNSGSLIALHAGCMSASTSDCLLAKVTWRSAC